MSENHQPHQVSTLSQHDHIHLNSNHANLASPNQDLHITTVPCHSPLSCLGHHDHRTHLLLLPSPTPILILNSCKRDTAGHIRKIRPLNCSMLPCHCWSVASLPLINKHLIINLILLIWSPSVVWQKKTEYCEILLQFKTTFYVNMLKCNLLLWSKLNFSIITPVFNSEIILTCWFAVKKNLPDYYQCWKQLWCLIFLWKSCILVF